MSEEEKEAIEDIKEMIELNEDDCLMTTDYDFKCLQILLNLIDKQQKEIEALKIIHESYKEVVDKGEFISKDKIKAKIKDLEICKSFSGNITEDYYLYKIEVLEELLEGE